jgi:hypothetical protein
VNRTDPRDVLVEEKLLPSMFQSAKIYDDDKQNLVLSMFQFPEIYDICDICDI